MEDRHSHQLTAPLGPGKVLNYKVRDGSKCGLWSSLMSASAVVQVHVLAAAALLAASVMIAVGSRSRMVPAR